MSQKNQNINNKQAELLISSQGSEDKFELGIGSHLQLDNGSDSDELYNDSLNASPERPDNSEAALPQVSSEFQNHPYARPGPMMDIGRKARATMKTKLVKFTGKILIIGCGAVAQCILPLLPKMLQMPMSNVTVIDLFDNRSKIQGSLNAGVNFFIEKVTKDTMEAILNKYLKAGDLLIDLAYEIPTIKFLDWCRANDVKYINAALEVENPYNVANSKDVQKFTLYERHQQLEKHIKSWESNDGPTAVIEHGANPGLVSHFIKLGLVHIAEKVLNEKKDEAPERLKAISTYLSNKDFPRLAMTLGVKVIHISERDTQVTSQPKKVNEFVNTWSPMGFYQEGIAPAELGWGTHEETLPKYAETHKTGPQHQICIRTKGINTQVRSWVPTPDDDGNILGMVVRHGEAYTIPEHLSVFDDEGKCIYRPTCHYAYCPTDAAMNSLQELRMRGYKVQPTTRVLKDDTVSGSDILGCLLMGHDFESWWIGSRLDIHEARDLIPHQNATVVQVGVGLVSAIQFMIENPNKGVCVPDDLPYEDIIRCSLPYLGPFLSIPVAWNPLKAMSREEPSEYRQDKLPDDSRDPWQFASFLFE